MSSRLQLDGVKIMKQLTLRLETSFRNIKSKYFDSLVGQIENPDRLSASEAEKKRAADGILEISIWKRGRGRRASLPRH